MAASWPGPGSRRSGADDVALDARKGGASGAGCLGLTGGDVQDVTEKKEVGEDSRELPRGAASRAADGGTVAGLEDALGIAGFEVGVGGVGARGDNTDVVDDVVGRSSMMDGAFPSIKEGLETRREDGAGILRLRLGRAAMAIAVEWSPWGGSAIESDGDVSEGRNIGQEDDADRWVRSSGGSVQASTGTMNVHREDLRGTRDSGLEPGALSSVNSLGNESRGQACPGGRDAEGERTSAEGEEREEKVRRVGAMILHAAGSGGCTNGSSRHPGCRNHSRPVAGRGPRKDRPGRPAGLAAKEASLLRDRGRGALTCCT